MRRRLPFLALWASLVYLLAAFTVTSKLCFDLLRAVVREAASATGGGFIGVAISPSWVVSMADAIADRLWWLCAATGFGILLTALSALWISLSPRASAA
jgi:hypothetical protein